MSLISVSKDVKMQQQLLDQQLSSVKSDLREMDLWIKEQLKNIASVEHTITEDSKELIKNQSEIAVLLWERRKKEVSIHTQIERVLEKYGITIQAYHGGTLTGVAIISLLNKHKCVMDDIVQICHDAIDKREHDTLPLRPPSKEEFDLILDKHRSLFQAQDAVYAH